MTGRPPVDLHRGSWFAKHGGARLRFGGVPGGPNVSSSKGPSPASERRKVPPVSKSFSTTEMSDALDDLLLHARATLKQLDAMRAQHAKNSGGSRQPVMRGLGGVRPHFWRPSCQAHLWTGATHDFDDLLFDSDEDLESSESEGSVDWDFLHGVRGAKPPGLGPFRSPAADAARAASTAKAPPLPKRVFTVPPPPPPRKTAKEDGNTRGATGGGAPPSSSGAQQAQGQRCDGAKGAQRGHAAGFRFGGAMAKAPAPTLAGPEAEVRASLEAAQSSGGADGGRQALKRLLLRWHPDKAQQGESPEAKAAQAEATRVLRFILQERERLGL
ncbi:Ras-related protein Rab-13 [Durusdinium trenchii]|uniref:Ras-related protein Rab-13 n=1 Tax=Durusdinium trenchii TaxID=1381693 RepID=A0ABP0KCC7_9DINO